MTTRINVTVGPQSLRDRNRQEIEANRLRRAEYDAQQRTKDAALLARIQQLAQQGLNADGTPKYGDLLKPQFMRQKPAAFRHGGSTDIIIVRIEWPFILSGDELPSPYPDASYLVAVAPAMLPWPADAIDVEPYYPTSGWSELLLRGSYPNSDYEDLFLAAQGYPSILTVPARWSFPYFINNGPLWPDSDIAYWFDQYDPSTEPIHQTQSIHFDLRELRKFSSAASVHVDLYLNRTPTTPFIAGDCVVRIYSFSAASDTMFQWPDVIGEFGGPSDTSEASLAYYESVVSKTGGKLQTYNAPLQQTSDVYMPAPSSVLDLRQESYTSQVRAALSGLRIGRLSFRASGADIKFTPNSSITS